MNNRSSSLQPFKNHKKPWPGRKHDDVSQVPCYLQLKDRQGNIRAKALSVGVVDWGLLERWAYHRKCATHRASTSSNSHTSSSKQYFKINPNVSFEKGLLDNKPSSVSKAEMQLISEEKSGDRTGFQRPISTCHDSYKDTTIPSKPTSKDTKAPNKHNLSEKEENVNHKPGSMEGSIDMEQYSQISCELQKVDVVPESSLSTTTDHQTEAYRKSFGGKHRDNLYIAHSCPLSSSSPADDLFITLDFARTDTKYADQDTNSAKNGLSCKQFVVGQSIKYEISESEGLANRLKTVGPKRMITSAISKQWSNDSIHSSTGDTTNNHNISRRSPLRRIIDPMLKLKDSGRSSRSITATPKRHSYEPSKSDKMLICEEIKLSFSMRKTSSASVNSANELNKGESQEDVRYGSSTRQALLQMSWKNGLPMFMLSSSDNQVLAATSQHLGNIYTIFSVDKCRKKGLLWGKHQLLASVGQLKVSNDCDGQQKIVLYGSELVRTKEDCAPSSELAAFIINGKECASGFIAILARGLHGWTIEGKPSCLIERWQSGGACDCGGWDEGCHLTVLNYNSVKPQQDMDKFQLSIQGAANSCALSLECLKEGLYSVTFKSSIAFVQALAICIAYAIKHSDNNNNTDDDGTRPSYTTFHPPLSPVRRA